MPKFTVGMQGSAAISGLTLKDALRKWNGNAYWDKIMFVLTEKCDIVNDEEVKRLLQEIAEEQASVPSFTIRYRITEVVEDEIMADNPQQAIRKWKEIESEGEVLYLDDEEGNRCDKEGNEIPSA